MKLSLLSGFLTVSTLCVSTVDGQAFGVGKKKAGASFQELNEQAKNAAAGGGMGDLDAMMREMGIDPSAMMGDVPELDEMMKMMAEMSPEELAKQMQDAMELFTGDDMLANMLGSQDEILSLLEETGAIDAEELAKFKADPEYFEQQISESMNQMKEMMADPKMLANAAEGMRAAQEMYNNPDALNDMMGNILKELGDDEIEEVRQMLAGGGGDPMMKELLAGVDTGDIDKLLADPLEWRKAVKEGLGALGGQGGAGGNKIVGEL